MSAKSILQCSRHLNHTNPSLIFTASHSTYPEISLGQCACGRCPTNAVSRARSCPQSWGKRVSDVRPCTKTLLGSFMWPHVHLYNVLYTTHIACVIASIYTLDSISYIYIISMKKYIIKYSKYLFLLKNASCQNPIEKKLDVVLDVEHVLQENSDATIHASLEHQRGSVAFPRCSRSPATA